MVTVKLKRVIVRDDGGGDTFTLRALKGYGLRHHVKITVKRPGNELAVYLTLTELEMAQLRDGLKVQP